MPSAVFDRRDVMQRWPHGPKKPLFSMGFKAKTTCPTVAALAAAVVGDSSDCTPV